ncbi:MAG: hypothetical protein FWF63_02305, partial [Fibromonadales bacterium]|nr:hypothetical protein [Fibromonadales bacterium]
EIFCGDIYAVKGMEHKKTGDYSPLLQMRIECLKESDWEAANAALKSIERTDNSVKVSDNSDGSWTLHAMGAVQFDFILSRLKREFRCDVRAGEPSVEFREMLSKKLDAIENFCQIGDTSVKVSLSAEPNSAGFAVEGSEEKWKDTISSALDEFCQSGVLGKGMLGNVKFILHKFEVQGSSQAVIKKACLDAAKMLVEPSSVQIYEPWVNLTVQCPSLFAGTVASDLLSRGAKIINSDGDGKKARFYAEAPLSKLARYTTELLSITKGGGNFFLHYLKHKELL